MKCLGWLLGLWNTNTDLRRVDGAADALAEAEAAEEITPPGFRWTEESSRTVHPCTWTPQSSATTPASPVAGGRQTRPAPPAPPVVEARATPGRSEMLYESAGVISMLMPGNGLVDELRELAAQFRDIEDASDPMVAGLLEDLLHPET